jgi:hypothetical protein
LGYQTICAIEDRGDRAWWWRVIWKFKCPLKAQIFMWLAMNNKVLTWKKLQKRGMHGPGWCILCKEFNETIDHMLMSCSYKEQVWKELERMTGIRRYGVAIQLKKD